MKSRFLKKKVIFWNFWERVGNRTDSVPFTISRWRSGERRSYKCSGLSDASNVFIATMVKTSLTIKKENNKFLERKYALSVLLSWFDRPNESASISQTLSSSFENMSAFHIWPLPVPNDRLSMGSDFDIVFTKRTSSSYRTISKI